MKTQYTISQPCALPRVIKASFKAGLLPVLFLLFGLQTIRGGSATWTSAVSGDWNTADNWSPQTVPNSPADTATFHFASAHQITLSADTEVNGIVFDFSFFTIFVSSPFSLTLSGTGVTNLTSGVQNFYVFGTMSFTNSATVGSLINFTNYGVIQFSNTSGAGNYTYYNQLGSQVVFLDNSTAGTATLTTDRGLIAFQGASTAAQSVLVADGSDIGGQGGSIQFSDDSTGDRASLQLAGSGNGDATNGNLDISSHNPPGVSIASIARTGNVFLGANNLNLGHSRGVVFSGVIQDGGIGGGVHGSLTKVGGGTLTLTHASTYTGGTIVSKGTLLVTNTTGSATGRGPVQVKAGSLGGTGTISGAVTVASGSTAASLDPGIGTSPGTITILKTLKFNTPAIYKMDLNSSSVTADQVVAKGVIINSSALVSIADFGSGTLPPGTVFIVISNTAATPITGTFSNLPDGDTLTVNGNNLQVSYSGGDGNDLTLTVVP